MPQRRIIDPQKLLKRIDKGMVNEQILKKYGFDSSEELKRAYAPKPIEPEYPDDTVQTADSGFDHRVKVNKWGSLIIPKPMADALGLSEGDRFRVRPSAAGLSLKRTGD